MNDNSQRQLGLNGPGVFPVGFGCFNIAGGYGCVDNDEAIAAVRAAIDAGVTLFDTADFYGAYSNESVLARALGRDIREVTVSTKTGVLLKADGSLSFDARPATIKTSCEASLRRLGVEVIDLYLLGRVDKTVPIEETIGAFGDLVIAGKVKNIGLCEVSAATVRKAHAVHPISAVQNSYSLLDRSAEADLLPTLKELKIALMAYSPLGRGLLSGSVVAGQAFEASDFRSYVPMFAGENLIANINQAKKLANVAKRLGVHTATLALAWLLAKDASIVPIPGTRKSAHVQTNVAASALSITDAVVAELDVLFPLGAANGDRYPEFLMSALA